MPFLILFESSTGAPFAIPAKAKTVIDRYMMEKRRLLNGK